MPKNDPQDEIEKDVESALALENELATLEQELMQNEQFKRFIEMQKTFSEKSQSIFDQIKDKMIEHDIKSVKGEWGSITVVDKTYFKTDMDALPRGYKKLVADTKKIGDHYKLKGKPVKGTEPEVKQHLMKRFK